MHSEATVLQTAPALTALTATQGARYTGAYTLWYMALLRCMRSSRASWATAQQGMQACASSPGQPPSARRGGRGQEGLAGGSQFRRAGMEGERHDLSAVTRLWAPNTPHGPRQLQHSTLPTPALRGICQFI